MAELGPMLLMWLGGFLVGIWAGARLTIWAGNESAESPKDQDHA